MKWQMGLELKFGNCNRGSEGIDLILKVKEQMIAGIENIFVNIGLEAEKERFIFENRSYEM
jgi:hypothetical protein